jgi:uncharacterized membrane protein
MKRKANLLLFSFNMILLAISWVMAIYAYSRLPARMPLWINFFGREPSLSAKSPVFLLYVVGQTLLVAFVILFIRVRLRRQNPNKSLPVRNLREEFILLALIFFQLLFIHVQRSLILMAHGIESGIRPFYFYSVVGIIFLLIPLYRMRLKILERVQDQSRRR